MAKICIDFDQFHLDHAQNLYKILQIPFFFNNSLSVE